MLSTLAAHRSEDLGPLAHHMSRLMHKAIQSGFSPESGSSDWVPSANVCETPDHYEVVVDAAGVRREDIEIYTVNRFLTVSGYRGDPSSSEKVCLHQMEIEQGTFRRRLRLPPDAAEEDVTARYRDGLLTIRIPKRS